MIITKLIGGLGNQMFQYAVGRRAAHVNNTSLKLDITGYENQEGITPRKYSISIFNIKEEFARPNEIRKLKIVNRYLSIISNMMIPYYRAPYIKQRYFHFDPNILKIKDNAYLEGYWSSEKYFIDIEDIICKEFTFKDKPDTVNQQLINRIRQCNSASIHVRRGDYTQNQKTNKFHGVCGLNYYLKTIKVIATKIKSPVFFIFSDDPLWVKQNLRLKFPSVYVTHNLWKMDYEDMRLMSMCKHNIIANSSFSWWGAWLNRNPNKIVISPKRWFRDSSINTKDLIPQTWTKI